MEREAARENKQWPQRPRPARTLVAAGTRGYRRAAVQSGISERAVQLASAVAAVALAIFLAAHKAWPFAGAQPKLPARPSLWQLLLSDQMTLGFVRLAFVMLAVFVIASVPALVAGGKWLKGLGAGGLVADDAADLRSALAEAWAGSNHPRRRANDQAHKSTPKAPASLVLIPASEPLRKQVKLP
jgi:hypothetical protein